MIRFTKLFLSFLMLAISSNIVVLARDISRDFEFDFNDQEPDQSEQEMMQELSHKVQLTLMRVDLEVQAEHYEDFQWLDRHYKDDPKKGDFIIKTIMKSFEKKFDAVRIQLIQECKGSHCKELKILLDNFKRDTLKKMPAMIKQVAMMRNLVYELYQQKKNRK